jgi:hypothetical protein
MTTPKVSPEISVNRHLPRYISFIINSLTGTGGNCGDVVFEGGLAAGKAGKQGQDGRYFQ